MQRRKFIQQATWLGLGTPVMVKALTGGPDVVTAGLRRPVFVYNNWSAYDELSDKVVQTRKNWAMKELGEILRLRKTGVQIDYYVMDAFRFDKNGGYRTWNKEHWPNGPGKWLEGCRGNGIRPGMWFSTNLDCDS